MMNAFKAKAKRCCTQAYENLVRKLGYCKMESNNSKERHTCYKRKAKESGRSAKACMAEGNI